MTRYTAAKATWRETRRESFTYRCRCLVLAWQTREIIGPEPTWSM